MMGGVGSFRRKQKRSSSNSQTNIPIPNPKYKYKKLYFIIPVIVFSLFIYFVLVLKSKSHRTVQNYSVDIVNEFPHDPKAFTQGLLYAGNDTLFESTGLHGQSSVRKVALQTGKVEALHEMANSEFGEGLTLLGQRLYQVTWLKQTGFIYDPNNLKDVKKFTHQMQDGWGLATDGQVIYGSDGSSTLYHIDPQTFKVTKMQTIKYKEHEVHNLNELEYINGEIWANVWMSDCIARISPEDGLLLGWILLPKLKEGLMLSGNNFIDVLNGIAWDSARNRIFGVSPLVGFGTGVFTVGQAATSAAARKIEKHEKSCLENQHTFIPFAFDTFGFLAFESVELLRRVQKVMNRNVLTAGSVEYVFRRIGYFVTLNPKP